MLENNSDPRPAPGLEHLDPRRILVCQQRQIGDVLLAGPALEMLKRRFPKAEVHLFTEAKCAPLMEENPNIDALLIWDRQRLRGLWAQLSWYLRLAGHPYDLCVDFQQLPRCRFVTLASRAPVRISFRRRPIPFFGLYTHCAEGGSGYAAAGKASILSLLGLRWQGERPRIFLRQEEQEQANRQLADLGLRPGQTLIALAPTHKSLGRRWPAANYAKLIGLLAEADADRRFLLQRGYGEEETIQEVIRLCPCREKILLPPEPQPLRIFAACLGMASLLIGNCSAPRHMAVAMNTPSLIIPGTSSSEWTFPDPAHQELRADLPCNYPCWPPCTELRCLTLVTPEMAASKAETMLRIRHD
ncbi:MAG: glycosyltransferase family 9 protein [Desulfovibrionaceae bacterium]|nr:glycosyltransferase family 9 protein [Desulfovibrionaceae bacterium]